MLINSIGFKYCSNNIVFKGDISSKKVSSYEPALNVASKNVMEYFSNERNKIQNQFDKFTNNWREEQGKAFQLIHYTPVCATFFSDDKSEKVSVLNKNIVEFEDKNSKKYCFKNNKWSDNVSGIENSLMNIINNNVKDGEEKARLMFSLSDVYLSKFLDEKDASSSTIINNIHNLFECVTNMYNVKAVEYNARQFFKENRIGKSHYDLEKDGWKIFHEDYSTFLSFDRKNECYKFIDKDCRNMLLGYEKKFQPKYSLSSSPLRSSYKETFFDSQGNRYNRSCDYNFCGDWIVTTEAEIKGFGKIKCKNVLNNKMFYYQILQNDKEPQTFKLDIGNGTSVNI